MTLFLFVSCYGIIHLECLQIFLEKLVFLTPWCVFIKRKEMLDFRKNVVNLLNEWYLNSDTEEFTYISAGNLKIIPLFEYVIYILGVLV